MTIDIRNIQGDDAFLHIHLREPPRYLRALRFLHHNNHIRPGEVLGGHRLVIIEAG
jgi:hypothetical protein